LETDIVARLLDVQKPPPGWGAPVYPLLIHIHKPRYLLVPGLAVGLRCESWLAGGIGVPRRVATPLSVPSTV
jgi:hypothetical protein